MKKIANNKLATGPGTIRRNVAILMQPARSAPRKKAILTIARKHNVPIKEAQFKQALAIARTATRKK